jgi:hypothetical protein
MYAVSLSIAQRYGEGSMALDALDALLEQIAKSTQHRAFYHFTDTRNLPSIRKHGILSAQKLAEEGVKVIAPGGNEWSMDADKRAGMDGYVHLCFTTNHPMEFHAKNDGRIIDVAYLQVRPEVIRHQGVMITSDVANKAGVEPGLPSEMLPKLDLPVIYTRTDWKRPEIKQRLQAAQKYEILVPQSIPLDLIAF